MPRVRVSMAGSGLAPNGNGVAADTSVYPDIGQNPAAVAQFGFPVTGNTPALATNGFPAAGNKQAALFLHRMMYKKSVSREQALQKLKHYCGYQERCHSEVRDKLFQLGVFKKDHDQIIATLIEENYLNEERFAIAFAGGKFRIKNWGRARITAELKQRQVSDYCIRKAMKQIEDEDYLRSFHRIAENKFESLKGEPPMIREKKTREYLMRKGYEMDLVNSLKLRNRS